MILGGATGGSKTELRQSDLVPPWPTGLGVGDDVALPGYMPNPYPYMARARVFALTSAWEGFGNVLVEAMACGCPVVATDCPTGPAEILDGGRFGPLVPVGDAPALAAAIASVLANPTDAQSCGNVRTSSRSSVPWTPICTLCSARHELSLLSAKVIPVGLFG